MDTKNYTLSEGGEKEADSRYIGKGLNSAATCTCMQVFPGKNLQAKR